MANKKPIIIVFFIIFPVARMAKQPKAFPVTDAVNKQKEQERVQKLIDEVAREIELSCNSVSGCPAGWVRHRNACYYINATPTIKWADARTTCQNIGADLPIIKSSAENDFIIDMVLNQDIIPFFGVWLGMQRKDKKLDLHWIDGSSLEKQAYLNWNHGEPNNGGVGGEHCGNMYLNGKWGNIHCECNLDNGPANCPIVVCQKPAL